MLPRAYLCTAASHCHGRVSCQLFHVGALLFYRAEVPIPRALRVWVLSCMHDRIASHEISTAVTSSADDEHKDVRVCETSPLTRRDVCCCGKFHPRSARRTRGVWEKKVRIWPHRAGDSRCDVCSAKARSQRAYSIKWMPCCLILYHCSGCAVVMLISYSQRAVVPHGLA
jgi:hypothetical protein